MKHFHKFRLFGSVAPLSLLCSIDGEGDAGSDGGSSGGGQPAGNASPAAELSTAQQMEKEFGQDITPEDNDDGSEGGSGAAAGDDDDDDPDDSGEGEGDGDADGDESGENGEGEAATPPKKNRAQERIDELTAKARDQEREAEKWKAEAIKHGYVEGDAPIIPEEPDPADEAKYPYGEHDLEYIKDRAKFDAKMETITEQAQANFKAEAASLEAKWTKNLAGAAEAFPDFDEVVVKGADKWACPPVIAIGIKDSDVGPAVAYELAKNPDEALRISKLSPLEQARAFGRLEQKHITKAERAARKAAGEGAPAATPKPAPKIVSKAPEPPRRQIRGGTGGRAEFNPETDDFAAFERGADARINKANGR